MARTKESKNKNWEKRLESVEFGFDLDKDKLKVFIKGLLADKDEEIKILKEALKDAQDELFHNMGH